MGGDDYHTDWPLVIWAVNSFVISIKESVKLTTEVEDEQHSKYPSWFLKKSNNNNPLINETLYSISQKEKKRIHWRRTSIWFKFFEFIYLKLISIKLKIFSKL